MLSYLIMKNTLDILKYISGTDFLLQRIQEEKQLLSDATGQENALPFEADIRTAGHIYTKRLQTMLEYPIVLSSRWTGVDALQAYNKQKGNKLK